jgi:hypothetical protein
MGKVIAQSMAADPNVTENNIEDIFNELSNIVKTHIENKAARSHQDVRSYVNNEDMLKSSYNQIMTSYGRNQRNRDNQNIHNIQNNVKKTNKNDMGGAKRK